MAANQKDLIQLFQKYVHDTKMIMATWTRPQDQWIKINTDGSALNNHSKTEARGILRDQEGKLQIAFASPLGEGTINQVEIEASIFGMTCPLLLGYKQVILELDSQLVVKWILHKTIPQRSITTQLERIQTLITQAQKIRCIHTLREDNWDADSLSKNNHKVPNI